MDQILEFDEVLLIYGLAIAVALLIIAPIFSRVREKRVRIFTEQALAEQLNNPYPCPKCEGSRTHLCDVAIGLKGRDLYNSYLCRCEKCHHTWEAYTKEI